MKRICGYLMTALLAYSGLAASAPVSGTLDEGTYTFGATWSNTNAATNNPATDTYTFTVAQGFQAVLGWVASPAENKIEGGT